MSDYTEATYGDTHAEIYDNWYASYEPALVETLAELARGGPALELGIGTGRVALPLQASGVEVHGIDASPAMVAKLRSKPGGDTMPIRIGNFADVAIDGQFNLIYVVINTFFSLLSQEEQVRCFRNVSQHLTEKGIFVLEVFVPNMSFLSAGQHVRVSGITTDRVSLHVSLHDLLEQRVKGQQIIITAAGVQLYPVEIRYAWPSELDLMAELAGLELRHRWSSWRREPVTNRSKNHISVYGRKINCENSTEASAQFRQGKSL